MDTAPEKPDDPWARMPGPSVVAFGFDVLDRVEQAVAMVKERLKRAVVALDAAGIPHAVVGGHAVAAWVARIDAATLDRVPPVLRLRLEEILANPEG